MNRAIPIGRIGGIEITLNWSLLIIFFLVAFSLGASVLPAWHPDWRPGLVWLIAFAAAALFLASLLVHELAHALVGRALGVEIRRVTLFIFGGMAQLDQEPRTWRAEFWMALAGPAMSLAIGVACLFAGTTMAARIGFDPEDPARTFAALGPAATVVLWLGPINIVLALFNLVPGFPLDGGRILRAALWGITGDICRATRWASGLGRAFGLILMAAGFAMVLRLRIPYLGTGLASGVWLMLIGWFLRNAAVLSYRTLLAQRSLEGVPVSRLMLADVATVDPGLPVSALIDDYLIAHGQGSFPVVRDGSLVGQVGFEQVRKLAPEARGSRTVGDIMTPASELAVLAPDAPMADALGTLSRRAVDSLPVVAGGQIRGMLRREDVFRWLALRGDESAAARNVGQDRLRKAGPRSARLAPPQS